MSKTIYTSVSTGVTLTGKGTTTYTSTGLIYNAPSNPLSITSTGTIKLPTSDQSDNAVFASGAYNWSVTNDGLIYGVSTAVLLAGGPASVTNTGSIVSSSGGPSTAGIGLGTGIANAQTYSVSNAAGGLIQGYDGIAIRGGSGIVTNSGTVSAEGNTGVVMTHGGTVVNTGSVKGADEGVRIAGAAGTIENGGTITGDNGAAIEFDGSYADRLILDAGSVINGVVDGGSGTNTLQLTKSGVSPAYGTLTGFGAGLSFTNFGTVVVDPGATWTFDASDSVAAGVTLTDSGLIDNKGVIDTTVTLTGQASSIDNFATIKAATGVYADGTGSAAVENHGTILGTGSAKSAGVDLTAGGLVTNDARASISGDRYGIYVTGAAGKVVNRGTIGAIPAVGAISRSGVYLNRGGILDNDNLVIGTRNGVFVAGGNGTVTDAGTITGGSYAIYFYGSFADRLILDPGAGLAGTVMGGHRSGATNTLELAAVSPAATGTLTSFGTQFKHFGTIVVDAKASWAFASTDTVGAGITLTDAGTLANAGSIGSTVTIAAGAGSLTNTGTIGVTASQAPGVTLVAGGTVSNGSTLAPAALIEGASGIASAGAALVVNAGTIIGTLSTAVQVTGGAGTVINTGVIDAQSQSADGVILFAGGMVTNAAGASVYGGDAGIYIKGGSGTVTNAGTIGGGLSVALVFSGSFADRLILDPGAVLDGHVVGSYKTTGAYDTLELAPGSPAATGTLTGFSGTNFTGFGTVAIDASAGWAFDATDTIAAGITLTDAGTLANAGSIAAVVTVANGASLTNAGTIDVAGGQQAVLLKAAGAISNGSAAAPSALIEGTSGINGLFGTVTTVTNAGTIIGTGSSAVVIASGVVENDVGGVLSGAAAGVAIVGGSGTVTNAGTISGQSGTAIAFQGAGTDRVILKPGSALNGTVTGGSGTNTLELAAGTPGSVGTLAGFDTEFVGFGTIVVDAGADWVFAAGETIGAGVTLTNSGTLDATVTLAGGPVPLTDTGTISGAAYGVVALAAATIINSGTIAATGSSPGYGVELAAGGAVTNTAGGAITGGLVGVEVHGAGTVTDAGTISGTDAIAFSGTDAGRLILDPGAVLQGVVAGATGTGATNTLELAAGSASPVATGTLTGFSTQFTNVGTIVVDAGAHWVFAASSTIGAGVSLTNAGTLGATVTMASGAEPLTNTGTIDVAGAPGVYLDGGGTVANGSSVATAALIEGDRGVYGYGPTSVVNAGTIIGGVGSGVVALGGLSTVTNTGTIESLGSGGGGVALESGGSVDNQAGTIMGGGDGVYGVGEPTTVTNTGLVEATGAAGIGIKLLGGGSVVNGSAVATTALIEGYRGVYGYGPIFVANAGTIIGTGRSGLMAIGGLGTVTNTGTIKSLAPNGSGVALDSGGSVANGAGTIKAAGYGVYGAGAPTTVTNAGLIMATGTAGIGVDLLGGGTVTDAAGGTIGGGRDAIAFAGTGANRVVLEPGAVLQGGVAGATGRGATNTLELAPGSATPAATGTLTGFSTKFKNFGTIVVDTGASWVLGGAGETIAAGVVVDGALSVDESGPVVLSGPVTGTGSLTLYGSVGIAAGDTVGVNAVFDAGTLQNAGDIDTTLAMMNGAAPLTNTGMIGGYSYGVDGHVTDGSTRIVNSGSIVATRTSDGGVGVELRFGGTVTNQAGGLISGAFEGVHIFNLPGTVADAGTISGGNYAIAFGGSDNRVILDPGAVLKGRVAGGSGTNTLELAPGAATGTLTGLGTQFTNFGTIDVDGGATWVLGGSGETVAAGIDLDGSLTVDESGTVVLAGPITGGGGLTIEGGVRIAAGTAIGSLSGADVAFTDAGSLGNAGVIDTSVTMASGAGPLANSGTIYGLIDGVRASDGVTITNSGSIGAVSGYAVVLYDGGAVTNQAGGVIHGDLEGVFVRNAPGTVTNAGSIGINGGGAGVALAAGGAVTNSAGGSIAGVFIGYGDGTITNAGTIVGVVGGKDQYAVVFRGTYDDDRLILDPGAVLVGEVSGAADKGATNTLELAPGPGSPAATGTLTGFSTQFTHFGAIDVDAGADWVLGGVGGATTLQVGGTVRLTGGNPFSGGATIGTGRLDLAAGATAGTEPITFAGPSGTLEIETVPAAGDRLLVNTIDGFAAGDVINLAGVPYDATGTATLRAGNVLDIHENGADYTLQFDPTQSFAGEYFHLSDPAGTDVRVDTVPCYCPGTLIATPGGEVPVEALSIGDKVVTAAGVRRPVKWIGRRGYDGRFIAGNRMALPIRFAAGSLGEGVPRRDLWVSPGHAMLVEDQLIHAHLLVNGVSIVQAEAVESVTYINLELDDHDVILAEGAPAESFYDNGIRNAFANVGEFALLYPDDPGPGLPCLPLLEQGFALDGIRRRIDARAGIVRLAPDAPGPLRGYVDIAGPDRVTGWAQDERHPEVPVRLDVLVDGRRVMRLLANKHRADLHAAGLGSGRHSFEIDLPVGCRGVVSVRRTDDGAALPLTGSATRALGQAA